MKRSFQKAAFVFSVLVFWLILQVPAMVATETFFPILRRPDGLYDGGDRMGLSVMTLVVTTCSANWVVSSLFQLARISHRRWSILRSPRSWE